MSDMGGEGRRAPHPVVVMPCRARKRRDFAKRLAESRSGNNLDERGERGYRHKSHTVWTVRNIGAGGSMAKIHMETDIASRHLTKSIVQTI